MLAIDILRWPGMNQAFIVSFVATTLLALAAIPYGKRRDPGRKNTWGEAMIGSTYVFAVLFLAFGVVPHQFIVHADNDLGWRKDKLLYGPFDLLKPDSLGGPFPITISYQAVRDIIVIVIHAFYLGLMMWLFSWWQKRGALAAAASKQIETSSYGRPLVRKA